MGRKKNSVEDGTSGDRINRRKFIQSLSVAGGSVAGATIFASGSVRAAEEGTLPSVHGTTAKEAVEQYDDVDAAKKVTDEQATTFLQKLSDDNYLNEGGIHTFDFSEIKTPWDAVQSGEGVAVAAIPVGGGEYVSELTLRKSTAKGRLLVTAIPELNRNFAILNPQDDENAIPIRETNDGVSPADFCMSHTTCFAPFRVCNRRQPAHRYKVRHCASGECYHYFRECCDNPNCYEKFICQCTK